MPTITKKTTTDAGTHAALAKLEDAKALLTTIQTALDRQRDRRTDNLRTPGLGWRHFGDAAHLLVELKRVADLLGIDRHEVAGELACPACGTRDADRLVLDEEQVHCTVCGCEYTLD